MKIRITSFMDKNKAFDMMKYITDRYPLEKDSKVVLNDDDTISLYLVVSDETKEEIQKNRERFRNQFSHKPEEFNPNISDEEIPF